jgi:hypothetical protein
MRMVDITGETFGKLKAVSPVFGGRAVKWQCVCECGKTSIVDGTKLRSGHTKSCGCLLGVERVNHGKSHTHEYRIWAAVKQRCRNQKNEHFKNYGSRGIDICDEWAESFEEFLSGVGVCPSSDHTIDRKDTNKGYEPGNVRWATREENQRNLRKSKRWVVDGVEYESLSHASECTGSSKATIQRWCDGGTNNGKVSKNKEGCFSYKIYED